MKKTFTPKGFCHIHGKKAEGKFFRRRLSKNNKTEFVATAQNFFIIFFKHVVKAPAGFQYI